MAISTYNTTFKIEKTSSGTSFTAFTLPIFDYPDMGSDPETIDVTVLTDAQYKYISGIKGSGALTFNANYSKEDFGKVQQREAAAEAVKCTLTLQDGSTLVFEGYVSVRLTGKGVNERVEMAVTVVPSTDITFTAYVAPSGNGAG